MPKPADISVDVLTKGATDVKLYQLWGHYLAEKSDNLKGLSSSQLRKFFGSLKKIQADFDKLKGEIILLDPKLAYAVGRDTGTTKTKIKIFYELLRDLIQNIDEDKKRFKNFVDVFESIVAYHREKETELGKTKDSD